MVKVTCSSLQATRAIHEMLLVPSQQSEVQTFFASLFVALLFQISSLVIKGSTVAQDEQHETESVNPVRYLGALGQCAKGYALCTGTLAHPLTWSFHTRHTYLSHTHLLSKPPQTSLRRQDSLKCLAQ